MTDPGDAPGEASPAVPITGPHLIREVHPDLAYRLGELWLAVTRAGGAVGFAADAPELDIRVAANKAVADVDAGRQHLLCLGRGADLVGTVFIVPGATGVVAHRGVLARLMVAPELRGQGCGGRLLDAALAHARSLHLEQLLLSTRAGTGLPEYYAARGWTEVGRWPNALRVAPGDDRDEVWFQRTLD